MSDTEASTSVYTREWKTVYVSESPVDVIAQEECRARALAEYGSLPVSKVRVGRLIEGQAGKWGISLLVPKCLYSGLSSQAAKKLVKEAPEWFTVTGGSAEEAALSEEIAAVLRRM